MSTSPVLSVAGVGKRYASYSSTLARAASWFGVPLEPASVFWANRDISFDVMPGEAVALIGVNGAGKSTLLKMVTGTVRPTVGHIAVRGRVSAILELGIGFNPELTGRNNIRQAGGLMGYTQAEIEVLMPEIEAFGELGDFFDQPLRTYSSGMQARLAFSLATAKRPDILIVDEVLSVGDSYFQHKSFDRIREFKDQGTSILLVTHSLGDVRALCDRVILLEKGTVLRDGFPDEVVDFYNARVAERDLERASIEQRRQKNGWLRTISGDRSVVLQSIVLQDTDGRAIETAKVGEPVTILAQAVVKAKIPRLVLGVMIRERTGHVVWGTNTWHTQQIIASPEPGEIVQFEVEFSCNLGPGSYSVSTALCAADTHIESNYEWQDNALVFDVINTTRNFFIGTSALDAEFTISRIPA